jgi:hypothetical protein
MSISNASADIQTGREVVLSAQQPSELTGPKYTAAQIANDCPARLQQIAREIAEEYEEICKQAERSVIAINKLITEAQGLCDVGGYDKFRELFCPQLGKSQTYVRLAIANGKTTLVEHRAKERERKQKTRANKRAAVANSGTVPEKADPETEAPRADIGEPANKLPLSEGPPKPPSNSVMSGFNSYVTQLKTKISNHKVDHFLATPVPADDLAKIGKFLCDLAILKKSKAVKLAPTVALTDNSTPSAEQSAEGVRENADVDAPLAALMPNNVDD